MKPNPYEPVSTSPADRVSTTTSYTPLDCAKMGFVLTAAVPVAFGLLVLRSELTYSASRPAGTGSCGMGLLAAVMLIAVGGPLVGTMGGLVGWLIGICAKRLRGD
jgi:hypothetical protein